METIYKIYFDYIEIKLDKEGIIANDKDCMYIAEYEWDEETEEIGKFIRRVNTYRGHVHEIPMDITVEDMEDMESLNELFDSPDEAYDALDEYLEKYRIWRTIYRGYYQPDEYECEGLEDRSEVYYRESRLFKKA